MNGVDWPAVKAELGPRAARAQTDGELRDVIRDMLGRLGLSHFAIIPSGRDNAAAAPVDLSGDPGFDVRLVGPELLVVRVDPDGGAAAAGVRPGWRLLAIDGLPIAEMLSRLPESMPVRLRNVEIWRMVETRLRGPLGSLVPLMFDDGVSDRGLTVARRAEPGQPATVGNLPTMHVRVESEERRTARGAKAGVIRFNVWMPGVDPLFQQAVDRFRAANGIVVDLRGNPGGLAAMIMGISGHFLTERKPLGTMKTRDDELRFAANPRLVNAAGAARRAVCRAGRHPRRRHDGERVGVFRRRHAGARAGPRLRADVDGAGASRVLRQAAERRRAHPRDRRFRDRRRHQAGRPRRHPRRAGGRRAQRTTGRSRRHARGGAEVDRRAGAVGGL